MGKDKLKRFAENSTNRSLYQPVFEEVFRKDHKLKGAWHQEVFGNNNPIVLELGCGRGEYSVEMAQEIADKNFIGIDIKGARLWWGAKQAEEKNLNNLVFLRTRIEFIESLFAQGEVSEIWITFADPQIKRRNKRLTNSHFLSTYQKIMRPDGIIHLKTDSRYLHDYTRAVVEHNNLPLISANTDIYGTRPDCEYASDLLRKVQTHYEKRYLKEGIKITYLCFTLPGGIQIQEPLFD